MKRLLILFLCSIVPFLGFAKFKIKKTINDDNIQINVVEKYVWKQAFSFKFMSARVVGISIDGRPSYFLLLSVHVDKDEFINENLLLKMANDSIVELPFAYSTMKTCKIEEDDVDEYSKIFMKYANDYDLDDDIFAYHVSEELMPLLIEGKIQKLRIVHKNGFDDMPVFPKAISEYLKESKELVEKAIKERKEFSKYKGF